MVGKFPELYSWSLHPVWPPHVQARVPCTTAGDVCGWVTHICSCLWVTTGKMKYLLGVFSFISFSHQHLSFPNRKVKETREAPRGPRTCWALHSVTTLEGNSLWINSGHALLQLSPAMAMRELQAQRRKKPVVQKLQTQAKVVFNLGEGRQDTAQSAPSLLKGLLVPQKF